MDEEAQKTRRKSREKLPTPPPDPNVATFSDAFVASNALDYINTLQRTMFTSVIATEDAFDHLDKLYKLMEQMLDLRQQNAKLLGRIKELEHLKNLGAACMQSDQVDFEDDAVFLDSILSETKRDKNASFSEESFRPSRKSSTTREKSSKVSKWKKVKAAFRWEKAASGVTGAKSQDSGIGGMTPVNLEIARYLRVPSSDETGNSPADSGAADGSTPGSLSSASSNDDLRRQDIRRGSQFSEDEDIRVLQKTKYTSKRIKTKIPDDVVERYRKAIADEEFSGKSSSRKRISKWIRVKKAFLNPAIEEKQNKLTRTINEGSVLYKTQDEKHQIQEEIDDNYRQLQDKLSLEFKGKLLEWEKLKLPEDHRKTDEKPPQIGRQQDLPPEFKKKLDEWQKIKKCPAKDDLIPKTKKKLGEWPRWKSVREDHHHQEPAVQQQSPPLSGDFLKKLEEWRKMKQPKCEHSLQWFELELDKIENQRKRLEKEKQKFVQREERLGKLRQTVLGDENKKEVLIRTSSGLYKFEGISKQFTQKLCEWENSRGIRPEESTFALLATNCGGSLAEKDQDQKLRLHRSKSADSLAIVSSHLEDIFRRASSLSLNDMEELERHCMALSESSSYQNIGNSLENVDEPEAMIVEVEDVEEETAAPLEEYLEEKHFPIYQRECMLNICEKQLVIPDVQEASTATNFHTEFGLLDNIIRIARQLKDKEGELNSRSNSENVREGLIDQTTQKLLDILHCKLTHLETQLKNIPQDLFGQIFHMVERLQNGCAQYTEMVDGILLKLEELKYFWGCETRRKIEPLNSNLVQHLVISTSTNYLTHKQSEVHEPTSLFVNTTRTLFTPLEGPGSPSSRRKLPKDISPGIRAMLAKYNEMVTAQEAPKKLSGGSSPIAWRSPVATRKVREKRDRFMDVFKSASSANLDPTNPPEGIFKSTSASVIQAQQVTDVFTKTHRAKQEFMRNHETATSNKFPTRSSRCSIASDSSCDSACGLVVKSASAGMINDAGSSNRHFGYLSLPRVEYKKGSRILANIAAKFRRVKMKRTKKMNAVQALCRQSLAVDLNPDSEELHRMRINSLTIPVQSSSEDTSPSSSRSGSWIRRPRIFK